MWMWRYSHTGHYSRRFCVWSVRGNFVPTNKFLQCTNTQFGLDKCSNSLLLETFCCVHVLYSFDLSVYVCGYTNVSQCMLSQLPLDLSVKWVNCETTPTLKTLLLIYCKRSSRWECVIRNSLMNSLSRFISTSASFEHSEGFCGKAGMKKITKTKI
jgi:hypothetical protein